MANNMKQKPNRAKKRNPADITLRNLRAIKKTVALLAADVAALDGSLILTNDRLEQLGKRIYLAKMGLFIDESSELKTKRGRR